MRIQPKVHIEGLQLPIIEKKWKRECTLNYIYPDGETSIVKYEGSFPSRPFDDGFVTLEVHFVSGEIYRSKHDRTGRSLSHTKRKYPTGYFEFDKLRAPLLDAATGRGDLVQDLRNMGFEAYGLDSYLKSDQFEKEFFIPGLLHRTGLPTNWAGQILANNVFSYGMSEKYMRKALHEFVRITRPGELITLNDVYDPEVERILPLLEGMPVTATSNNINGVLEIRKYT